MSNFTIDNIYLLKEQINSPLQLFKNYNKSSDYVPFYSVLYKDHLKENGNLIYDIAIMNMNLFNFKTILPNNLLTKLLYMGLYQICTANKIAFNKEGFSNYLKNKENKESLINNFYSYLESYIHSEPDLRINLPSIINTRTSSYLNDLIFDFNKFNDIFRCYYVNSKLQSFCGNGIIADVNLGVCSSLMVKREDVPMLRLNHLLTGNWDKSLIELWILKEFLNYGLSKTTINNMLYFQFDYEKVIVDNFNDIFYINPHKTLAERKSYLRSQEEYIFKKVQEGQNDYIKEKQLQRERYIEEIEKFGFKSLA